MRLSAWKYIFCLTIVFACGYANAGSIAKRDADDQQPSVLSGYVDSFIKMVRQLPLVGNLLGNFLAWWVRAIGLFEIGTNHALGRLLGGALPCTVDLSGTSCSGLTNNGGFGALLMKTVNDIPPYMLPGIFKYIIGIAIKAFIDPTMDVLLGGVTVDD